MGNCQPIFRVFFVPLSLVRQNLVGRFCDPNGDFKHIVLCKVKLHFNS